MYQVHNDLEAYSVCCINQSLELIRRTEATAGSEEARYVVAEGAVVRMLLHRHDLDSIVA